ncbi:MAG TPA: PDZ domain-containing protein, partial [Candidatus Eremiobacteraeota bacterium]|nr:PDZ domain-containing protein [Candidatus Eremiobacteraeota bacterium]
VVIKDLSSELSSYFGADNGVLIEDIIPGGPADNGGIKSGDIVLSIDDAEMDSVRKLQNTISGKSPGEKITLSVLRNKKKETVTLIVGQRPEERKKDISHSTVPHSEEWRGLSVEDLTDDLSSRLKQNKGVIVRGVKTGSLAEESGIKPGNIIIKINDRELNNIKDYKDFIKSIKNKEDVVCLVYDGKYMTFLVIKGE